MRACVLACLRVCVCAFHSFRWFSIKPDFSSRLMCDSRLIWTHLHRLFRTEDPWRFCLLSHFPPVSISSFNINSTGWLDFYLQKNHHRIKMIFLLKSLFSFSLRWMKPGRGCCNDLVCSDGAILFHCRSLLPYLLNGLWAWEQKQREAEWEWFDSLQSGQRETDWRQINGHTACYTSAAPIHWCY